MPHFIVYDKQTHRILRNTTEPPILAEGEAVFGSTPETHREDMARIRDGGPGAGDLSPVDQVEEARAAAIEFFDWYTPGHTHKAADMLPTPCSPTGKNPPSHYFCWWRAPREELDAGIAYAKQHGKPNIIEYANSKEEFLTRHGLRVIE